jgi:hypothetical protein
MVPSRVHCIPLLQGYEPKFWYFEVVILVLKLLLSAVTVLFLPESVAQVRVILLHLLIRSLVLLAFKEPPHGLESKDPACSGYTFLYPTVTAMKQLRSVAGVNVTLSFDGLTTNSQHALCWLYLWTCGHLHCMLCRWFSGSLWLVWLGPFF